MKIRFLGHACFLVTADSGTRIVFDPYEPGGFNGAIGHGSLTEPADVVVVSHDHADHNYVRGVPGSPQVVRGAGVHSAALILFRGIPLKHDAQEGRQRGANTVFCAEIDGLHLCHLGDLGHELEPAQVEQIRPVDVLLCPVGGTFTIDAVGATRVMEALNPRLTIPMHFKTPKVALPLAPVDQFIGGKQNVRRAGASEIAVTRETLPAAPQIVVLDPAL